MQSLGPHLSLMQGVTNIPEQSWAGITSLPYYCHSKWLFRRRHIKPGGLDKLPRSRPTSNEHVRAQKQYPAQVHTGRVGHEHQPLNHCRPRSYHPAAVILPNIEGDSLTTSTPYLCCWPLLSYTIGFLQQRVLGFTVYYALAVSTFMVCTFTLLSLIFFFQLLSGY